MPIGRQALETWENVRNYFTNADSVDSKPVPIRNRYNYRKFSLKGPI